jgi:hypothetical protein
MPGTSAADLKLAFRAIPKGHRDAKQPFAIRVWRGLSWLERAEQAAEPEDRFIFAWIGYNALYGRMGGDNRVWSDREASETFLATIWRIDGDGQVCAFLSHHQLAVLRLIESKFLYDRFWQNPAVDPTHAIKEDVRKMLRLFNTPDMLPILQALFDRLHVMRNQVFHGASTKGSKLNRRTLIQSGDLLRGLLPVMLDVMLRHGLDADWGNVPFPPIGT